MIRGLEHVAIASPDPDRLARWYGEQLGFAVESHSPGTRNYFLRARNGTRVEIILAESPLAEVSVWDAGLRHLALITDDFEADLAALQMAGAVMLSAPETRGGNRVVFFRDPDGNVLHLIQRPVPLS